MKKVFEPKSFWVFTTIILIIVGLTIVGFIWFFYIGHEPFEPVHDEEPHAFIKADKCDFGRKVV